MPADMHAENYGSTAVAMSPVTAALTTNQRVSHLPTAGAPPAVEMTKLGLSWDETAVDGIACCRLSESSCSGSSTGNLSTASGCGSMGCFVDEDAAAGNGCSNGQLHLKKSANMTECVTVPSSEHVAEIVGRQGCKIKALRTKTNTYIKTPVRGDEPIFVVTGRKEDVAAAKREILSAAEHFSQIRASRKGTATPSNNRISSSNCFVVTTAGSQITQEVHVPFRVVGLVVGPKGATIKRIQEETQTYIVTPSRDRDPVFEIIGLPENVEKARQEIESYIALRTKGGTLAQSSYSGLNNSWSTLNSITDLAAELQPKSASSMLNGMLFQPSGTTESSLNDLTSYNNLLNLGLGHLRLQKSQQRGCSDTVGRPFSLDAAELIDCCGPSNGRFVMSKRMKSFNGGSQMNEDAPLPDNQSCFWPEANIDMTSQNLSSLLSQSHAISQSSYWQDRNSTHFDAMSAPGEPPLCHENDISSHKAILQMCAQSIYTGSNSRQSDFTSVQSNTNSGSVSDSSSASPTDFNHSLNNDSFLSSDHALTSPLASGKCAYCSMVVRPGKSDLIQRCPVCH